METVQAVYTKLGATYGNHMGTTSPVEKFRGKFHGGPWGGDIYPHTPTPMSECNCEPLLVRNEDLTNIFFSSSTDFHSVGKSAKLK